MHLASALALGYAAVMGGVFAVLCGRLQFFRGTCLERANTAVAAFMSRSLWLYRFEKWAMPWVYPVIVVILATWNAAVLRNAAAHPAAIIEQAAFVTVSALLFLWLRKADPGTISRQTFSALAKLYTYDCLIYTPGRLCHTCGFERLPRSKHCRFCNICVTRYDHHCGWIGNCVGGLNTVGFLCFLSINAAMCARLGWIDHQLAYVLLRKALERNYPTPSAGGRYVMAKFPLDVGPSRYFQYAMMFPSRDAYLLSGCFAILTAALVAFTGYHIRLIVINKTTVEVDRWEDLKDAIVESPSLAVELGTLRNSYDRGWRANITEVLTFRGTVRSALRWHD